MARKTIARSSLYAHYQFGRFLLHEFRWPLGVLGGLVLVGGLLLKLAYHGDSAAPLSYPSACYELFAMLFFQQKLEFPAQWYLQPLFFVVPLVGLGAIADSLVRLGFLIVTRKQKLQEWQNMRASMMRDHIVVVGAGKVGYRIVKDLLALNEDVVAVERNLDSPLVSELLDLRVPVIQGEARLRKTLEQAGVAVARAVIFATDDDLANIDAALTAREIQPDVRVVLRLFDETMATKVAATFKMPAISTSATAAPEFIKAATGRGVLHSFCLDESAPIHVADVSVEDGSPLSGRSVGDVQKEYGVNIVMHKRDASAQINPEHDLVLRSNDRMLVIAPIRKLAELSNPKRRTPAVLRQDH